MTRVLDIFRARSTASWGFAASARHRRHRAAICCAAPAALSLRDNLVRRPVATIRDPALVDDAMRCSGIMVAWKAGFLSPAFTLASRSASISLHRREVRSIVSSISGVRARPPRRPSSPITMSPERPATPPTTSGKPTRPRAGLRRRVRRDAGGEARQPDAADSRRIAHQPVGDEGGDAAVLHHPHHQVADDRGLEKQSAAHITTSPGFATSSAPKTARQSAGPASQVSATPQKVSAGADRLDAMVERAAAAHGVDDVAGQRAGKGGDLLGAGRGKLRRTVRSGGSSIIVVPRSACGGGWRETPSAPSKPSQAAAKLHRCRKAAAASTDFLPQAVLSVSAHLQKTQRNHFRSNFCEDIHPSLATVAG